jgi:hypothetical protein
MNRDIKFARDFNCCECDNRADAFFGLADPDAEQVPMCNDCIKKAKIRIYEEIGKLAVKDGC